MPCEIFAVVVTSGLVGELDLFSFSRHVSPERTNSGLYPIFHAVMPDLTPEQFEPIHHIIRKTAHFTEYFVFCVLVFRGARGDRPGWRGTWALAALSIAAGYSALDEVHLWRPRVVSEPRAKER